MQLHHNYKIKNMKRKRSNKNKIVLKKKQVTNCNRFVGIFICRPQSVYIYYLKIIIAGKNCESKTIMK